MRSNQLVFVLVGVLFISTLVTTLLVYKFRAATDTARQTQPLVAHNIATLQQLTQVLLNESIEYSKRNPALQPVLEKFGITQPKPAGVQVAPTNPPKAPAR